MAAQIHEIATSAGGVLLGPILLIVPILLLATITGFTGRVALVLEDLRYRRIHSRNE